MVHAPLVYQLHVICALVFIGLWPFTRLVHVWSAPVAYLWRPYIVYRRQKAPAGSAGSPRAGRSLQGYREAAGHHR
jgi:nitrate reductase gamma subunit